MRKKPNPEYVKILDESVMMFKYYGSPLEENPAYERHKKLLGPQHRKV